MMNRLPADGFPSVPAAQHQTGHAGKFHSRTSCKLFRELHALEGGETDYRSNHEFRIVLVCRICRRIEAMLPGRFAHGAHTAECALALGRAIGMKEEELRDLHFATLLHDIGLITLPARLLTQPPPLAANEYAEVQSHPRAAADFLEPFPFLHAAAILIAHHHERWDGRGYPFGLRGPFIPLGSRVLAIADTFDMLVRETCLRDATAVTAALAGMRMLVGSQLDPALTEVFLNLLLPHALSTRNERESRLPGRLRLRSKIAPFVIGSHRFDEGFLIKLLGPDAPTGAPPLQGGPIGS
jgi:HD-GYP domain-containing protein (c-di-GMP phosphodiesterase class II)